jgi:hypothetical protein
MIVFFMLHVKCTFSFETDLICHIMISHKIQNYHSCHQNDHPTRDVSDFNSFVTDYVSIQYTMCRGHMNKVEYVQQWIVNGNTWLLSLWERALALFKFLMEDIILWICLWQLASRPPIAMLFIYNVSVGTVILRVLFSSYLILAEKCKIGKKTNRNEFLRSPWYSLIIDGTKLTQLYQFICDWLCQYTVYYVSWSHEQSRVRPTVNSER